MVDRNGKSDKRALEKIALESGEGIAPSTPVAAPPAATPTTAPAPTTKTPSEPTSFTPNKALKKTPHVPPKPFNQDLLRHLSLGDKQLFNQFGLGDREKPAFDLVHVAFEHYAQLYPENIAVEDVNGQKITYQELDRQSNCLSATLHSRGVKPGSRVCLLVERSIYMVIGILGILKAGGAYVPLDGNVVADKTLNHALKDSGSSLALVQRKFLKRVESLPCLSLEDVIHETHLETHCNKPKNKSKTSDSAYIIYTSGMLTFSLAFFRVPM
jgi:non-ribosomal peptide synthetase component F